MIIKTTYTLLLLIMLSYKSSAEETRPNIVFFIADDISQEDLGCYGHPTLKTPNSDALAASGMRFDNAYLTISSCSPSRCSILTGRYPHNTGAPELHTKLPSAQIRFPELLREEGYYTLLSGKNHMVGKKDRAFDRITRGGGPGSEEDWVKLLQERPKEKPFFCWFASTDAHRDWQISDEAPVYDIDDIVVPPYMVDTELTRQDLANYYHEVSRFDHYIGLVTAELKRQNVLENTLIVIAADNGRPFPRDKARLYDSGIKTPWIVCYPKMIQTPKVTKSLISSIDFSATCLELAGIKKPECIQGQSFVPIMKNPQASIRDLVFSEQNWHVYKNHSRMVRFGDLVYIRNNFPNQLNMSMESESYFPAGEELWKAHAAGETSAQQQQIFTNPCPVEEFYDVAKDPNQFVNLANNPEYASDLKKARKLLVKWTDQTGDTIPQKSTANRNKPSRIESGKVIPLVEVEGAKKMRGEMPGTSKNATKINHSGPIFIDEK